MGDAGYDFAIFGSTPLSHLLAGLLAAEHGKRVCLVGDRWSPYHLPRRFDLSAGPATRPETWALLERSTAETLRVLGGIGKGLYEHIDPLFVAEMPASIDMLSHMRHVAGGLGFAAERVLDHRIVGSGAGCRIRDAALLVPGRIEPALEAWLERHGVQRLPATTAMTIRRDGSVLLQDAGAEARQAVLTNDTSIIRQLPPEVLGRVLRRRVVSSVVTEPARRLHAPFIHYLDRGVALGQRGDRQPITAIASGTRELLPRIGSSLQAQVPLLRSGQSSFERLETVDGAPLVGALPGLRATVIAGLGIGGAFLAPPLARLLAGVPTEAEAAYFAARGAPRGNARQLVADWVDEAMAELAA